MTEQSIAAGGQRVRVRISIEAEGIAHPLGKERVLFTGDNDAVVVVTSATQFEVLELLKGEVA